MIIQIDSSISIDPKGKVDPWYFNTDFIIAFRKVHYLGHPAIELHIPGDYYTLAFPTKEVCDGMINKIRAVMRKEGGEECL